MDNIISASADKILEIDGFGDIMAKSVTEYFSLEPSLKLIGELKSVGMNMESQTEVSDTRFSGMTFVLTGTLPTYGRTEASEIIEKFGGKTSSSVSKKTTYVLAGDEAGSKLEKAQKLGIKIISEAEFNEMIK